MPNLRKTVYLKVVVLFQPKRRNAAISLIRKSRSLAAVLALFCSINTQKSLLNFAKQNLRLFCPIVKTDGVRCAKLFASGVVLAAGNPAGDPEAGCSMTPDI
jgi:hypothetical protein